jgi:hypothetical protein
MAHQRPLGSECLDDTSFGPVVRGCRSDFDFTLFFEHIILTIIPLSCLILLGAIRVTKLLRRSNIVLGNWIKILKQVRFINNLLTISLMDKR